MTTASTTGSPAGILPAAVPIAAAIGVFGVVYGAAASPVIGPVLTVIGSVIIFSGAAQFTMVALLAAGATPVGVLGAIAALAVRHLPLGAILRPRLTGGRVQRALVSWFLIDETTGLAVTRDGPAERTMAVSGVLSYGAWIVGTAVGVAGGTVPAVEPLAAALFPVLFREVAFVHEIAGLSDAEIARATGVAPATARAWLAQTRTPTGDRAERLIELSGRGARHAYVDRLLVAVDDVVDAR
jgi:predicted branched-subunit amino acid permease